MPVPPMLPILIPRHLKNKANLQKIISNSLSVVIALNPVIYAITFLISFFFFNESIFLISIALIYITIEIGGVISMIFLSFRYIKIRFLVDLLRTLCWTLLPIFLAMQFGVVGAVFGFSLTGIIFSIVSLLLLKRINIKFRFSFQKKLATKNMNLRCERFWENI